MQKKMIRGAKCEYVDIIQQAGEKEIIFRLFDEEKNNLSFFTVNAVTAVTFARRVRFQAAQLLRIKFFDMYVPAQSFKPFVWREGTCVSLLFQAEEVEPCMRPLWDDSQNYNVLGLIQDSVSPVPEKGAKCPAPQKIAAPAAKEDPTVAAKGEYKVRAAAVKTAASAASSCRRAGTFSFEAVGLAPGARVVFIDGRQATVADGGKIAYEGALYTLSGFCKKYMPEARRCKSDSYRGPAFFTTTDGTRLDKLAQGAKAASQASTAKAVRPTGPAVKSPAQKAAKKKTAATRPATEMASVPVTALPVPAVQAAAKGAGQTSLVPVAAFPVPSRAPRLAWLRRLAAAVVALIIMAASGLALGNVFAPPVQSASTVEHPASTIQAARAACPSPIMEGQGDYRMAGRPSAASDLGARSCLAAVEPKQEEIKACN